MNETKCEVLSCLKFGNTFFKVDDCVCIHYFDSGILKTIVGRISDIGPVNIYKDDPDFAVEIDTSEKYHSSDKLIYVDTIDSIKYCYDDVQGGVK